METLWKEKARLFLNKHRQMVCAINLQFSCTKQPICMLKKDDGGGRKGQLLLDIKVGMYVVSFSGNLPPSE